MNEHLDIEKAVNDAIQRAESESGRTVEMGATVSDETIDADITAGVGKGWSLAAIYRYFRKAKSSAFGARITKDF